MKHRIIVTEDQWRRLTLNEDETIPVEVQQVMDEYNLVSSEPIRNLLSMMDQKVRRDDIGNQSPQELQDTIVQVYNTLSELVNW